MRELAQEPIWYHRMNLGGEWTVPIQDWSGPWNLIREARRQLDYKGKRVLDLASFDGMWAFEAEELGASFVVATDCIKLDDQMTFVGRAYEKFLYARQKRNSSVLPYYNVSVHRLDSLLPFIGSKFDIIQNFGLLYHLENPWQALKQCRKVIADNGRMLIESAVITGEECSMRFNRGTGEFYHDPRSYWCPTIPCLSQMVSASGFGVMGYQLLDKSAPVTRATMLVGAIHPDDLEFWNDYRSL